MASAIIGDVQIIKKGKIMNKLITIEGAKVVSREILVIPGTSRDRKFAKIDIGNNMSFSLNPADPVLKKLAIGREISVTAKSETHNLYENKTSGLTSTFIQLNDVEITNIEESHAMSKFSSLSDDDNIEEVRLQSKAPTTDTTGAMAENKVEDRG